MKKITKIISLILILMNFVFILCFYFFANPAYLEGVPSWILAVIGAPTTFLLFPIFRLIQTLSIGISVQHLIVSLLLQLQYQAIIYFMFEVRIIKKIIKLIISSILIGIILLSAITMRIVIMPYPHEYEESYRLKTVMGLHP